MTHSLPEIPDFLYKYVSANSPRRIIRLLVAGELWFGSAKRFNDPFDTALTYEFDGYDGPIAEEWIVKASRKDEQLRGFSEEQRRNFIAGRLREIRKPGYLVRFKEQQIEEQYSKFGICSLSAKPDNPLMWAHYASQHTGLCVGLRGEVLMAGMNEVAGRKILIDPIKVQYSTQMPRENFFRAMLDDNSHGDIQTFLSTKSNDWAYEQEWRLVYWDVSDIAARFGPEVIGRIVFGLRTTDNCRDFVRSLCKRRLPHVQLCDLKKNSRSFTFDIVPVS